MGAMYNCAMKRRSCGLERQSARHQSPRCSRLHSFSLDQKRHERNQPKTAFDALNSGSLITVHREPANLRRMSQPLLSLSNVTVAFGPLLAVDDLSFELEAGQLLGLIGPNGAGKTTSLRAAAGLQPLVAGTVRVMGHDALRHPTRIARHLG